MSLVSYNSLLKFVERGIIDAPIANISGASIDITLGSEILIEKTSSTGAVDLANKGSLDFTKLDMTNGYRLYPGQFILASSQETFNLPNHIAAEYKLKSSLARSGLQHLLAGWCDPGWTNSKLTLELKNVTEHHVLVIKPRMKIGQMVFWKCEPVPDFHSYANKGQYNNQNTVTKSKGVR